MTIGMNTTEIFKAHAPQFVALDEAEKKATEGPWSKGYDEDTHYSDWLVTNPEGRLGRYIANFGGWLGQEKWADLDFVTEARNQARALLDAHAQLLVEREWRPIESAPKDGSHFLTCKFDPDSVAPYFVGDCYWLFGNFRASFGTPTHWKPLDPPPGAKP